MATDGPLGPVGRSAAPDWAHYPLGGGGGRLSPGGLLGDWQRRNADASLPLALRQLEDAGNLDNVRLAIRADEAAASGDPGLGGDAADLRRVTAGLGLGPVDPLPGLGYRGPVFMDSDIYKTLEAIGWELARAGASEPAPGADSGLTAFTSDVIALLDEAQRPDGYLNSYFQASGEPRYARLAWSHEMYCAGHLIQAAIALHRGAGDDRLLAIAVKLADHLAREFLGGAKGLDGHPIIETALAELYR
ncbi:MAG TPA: beta-L-arabinofuranosidase domain-containing protein, partial [Trebonia sp.]